MSTGPMAASLHNTLISDPEKRLVFSRMISMSRLLRSHFCFFSKMRNNSNRVFLSGNGIYIVDRDETPT